MSLITRPRTRDYTMSPTTPYKSLTGNRMQDLIIRLCEAYDLKHFKNGVDGGSNLVGGTTTLAKDPYYTNLTVGVGAILKPAGFAIYGTEYIDIAGRLDGSGANAAGGVGGQWAGPHGCPGASPVANDGASAFPWTVGLGGSAGVGVGNGGVGQTGAGGNGTKLFQPTSDEHKFFPFRTAWVPGGVQVSSVNPTATVGTRGGSLDAIRGGAGGGAGGGDGSNLGGAGGAGGQLLVLAAPLITFRATAEVWVNGGNGETPAAGNTGGGGAGGGGAILCVCEEFVDEGASYQASTGNHGFHHGASGAADGTVSADGNATPIIVLLDPWP